MAIQVRCPRCQQLSAAHGALAGKWAACPRCQGQVFVPGNPALPLAQPPVLAPVPSQPIVNSPLPAGVSYLAVGKASWVSPAAAKTIVYWLALAWLVLGVMIVLIPAISVAWQTHDPLMVAILSIGLLFAFVIGSGIFAGPGFWLTNRGLAAAVTPSNGSSRMLTGIGIALTALSFVIGLSILNWSVSCAMASYPHRNDPQERAKRVKRNEDSLLEALARVREAEPAWCDARRRYEEAKHANLLTRDRLRREMKIKSEEAAQEYVDAMRSVIFRRGQLADSASRENISSRLVTDAKINAEIDGHQDTLNKYNNIWQTHGDEMIQAIFGPND